MKASSRAMDRVIAGNDSIREKNGHQVCWKKSVLHFIVSTHMLKCFKSYSAFHYLIFQFTIDS